MPKFFISDDDEFEHTPAGKRLHNPDFAPYRPAHMITETEAAKSLEKKERDLLRFNLLLGAIDVWLYFYAPSYYIHLLVVIVFCNVLNYFTLQADIKQLKMSQYPSVPVHKTHIIQTMITAFVSAVSFLVVCAWLLAGR